MKKKKIFSSFKSGGVSPSIKEPPTASFYNKGPVISLRSRTIQKSRTEDIAKNEVKENDEKNDLVEKFKSIFRGSKEFKKQI